MKAFLRIIPLLFFGFLSFASRGQIIGNASYYSDKLHGRKMSDGQPYHRDSMTCAHLHFPFGTLLSVYNPLNGKEVVVKVTDRGPFSKRFVIDLSRAAARELDFITKGFTKVEITPYEDVIVPYKAERRAPKKIELDLDLQPIETFPVASWQPDSLKTPFKMAGIQCY